MTTGDPVHRVVKAAAREREEWRRTLEVVRVGLRGLAKSQIPRMGAALAYRTLFSLIPVLVVGVSVLGSFLSDAELRQQMDRLIDFVGLDSISIEQAARTESAPDTADSSQNPGTMAAPTTQTGQADAPAPPRLDEWIAALVARVSSLPYRAIGFVGVLVLLYGAISMLVELERSFNQIYGASAGRSWVKRVTTYWTTLTLGVVFLLATFSVGDAAGNWVASLGSGDGSGGWFSRGVVEFSVNIVINTLVLLLAYSTVPNARVHIRPALAGAAVAGIAWELGKIGFTQYVRHAVGGLEQLYGVLALLPLFMLWVYITWIIVLFGLQVSYTLQTFNSLRDARSDQQASGLVDPALTLAVAKIAEQRFSRGETLRIDDVVTATGVEAPPAERVIRGLVEGGILREIEQGDERAWVLARPADTITADELLAIGRRVRQGGVRGGVPEIDRELERTFEGITLSTLQPIGAGPDTQGLEPPTQPAPAAG